MRHLSSRRRCGQGGSAGVGEKVQHPEGSAGAGMPADQVVAPLPVHGLFRKKARVFEAQGL